MATLTEAMLLAVAAGAMIPFGGFLARREHMRQSHLRADLLHGLVAFGGGALLAAVALVLVPLGLEQGTALVALGAFVAGAGLFLGLDLWMRRRGTKGAQLMAMLLDYAPESLALGAALALGSVEGVLLAVLIGFQNLPEAFASTKDLAKSHWAPLATYSVLFAAVGLGPLAALLGYEVLADDPQVIAGIVMAASGGILALLFQDIVPAAKRGEHIAPTWGGILGFSVGLTGHLLL